MRLLSDPRARRVEQALDLLQDVLFGEWIVPAVAWTVDRLIPWPFAKDFLVGPYGMVSMALSYAVAIVLPIVGTFFLGFGILEDSGYLPRLAVMVDKVFKKIGCNGKAVLPMILGLGCDTMATLTTRILETRKERVIVTLLLALGVPCSAQLGVILGMLASVGPQATVTWLALLLGIILLVMGVREADSVASSITKFFTGNPTDRAVWLMIGGAFAMVLGLALGGMSMKTRNA